MGCPTLAFLSLTSKSWSNAWRTRLEDIMIMIFVSVSSLPLRALTIQPIRPQHHTPLASLAFHFLPTLRIFCTSEEYTWDPIISECTGVTRQPQRVSAEDGCEALAYYDWEFRDIPKHGGAPEGKGYSNIPSTHEYVVEDGLPFLRSSEY
ncbi:hypothetical protein BOTBODRAFT_32382 [Botryobasidium botryosum FD-172 SS1]|uniref:Uncharacterized protein n=1 Tax=Botryobasidium botryosum (strain FD-172 SS1) TaxID=930990 RepID=A0A067MSR1_BOTB1|nr:hypothetical protein BOTBODRAFT_32382 [Botryobasidium botryosum FD-172 SS1]